MPTAPDPMHLDEALIINIGGWDPRYARVVMVAVDDDVPITLVNWEIDP